MSTHVYDVTTETEGRVYPFTAYDPYTDTGAVFGFFSLGKFVLGEHDIDDCDCDGHGRGGVLSELLGPADGPHVYDESGMIESTPPSSSPIPEFQREPPCDVT